MSIKWLSAHLYYTEPFEKLLVEGIRPFVEKLNKEGFIEQYFFIRYWERGPHIRLRLKRETETLKPIIENHFTAFFERNHSQRDDPEWVKELPKEHSWLPNNSIQFIAYEPELDRYGGENAIEIAEQHFMDSSQVILEIIKKNTDWNYDYALGKAIQLHLGFAFSVGMSEYEAGFFFDRIFSGWFPRTYSNLNKTNTSPNEQLKIRRDIKKAFEKSFTLQAPVLIQFVSNFWDALHNDIEFEQEWLNQWLKAVKNTQTALCTCQKNNLLTVNTNFNLFAGINEIPSSTTERWNIYQSYVHMTNNRLGILNRDEGYLGYILKKCIKEITYV